MENLLCKCGAVIPNDNVSWTNRVNDLGEDVGTAEADCGECGEHLKCTEYATVDNIDAAIELLQWGIDENALD